MTYDFYVMCGESRYNVKRVGDTYKLNHPEEDCRGISYPMNSNTKNWINTVEHIYEKAAPSYSDSLSFTHDTAAQQYNLQRIIVSDEDHSVVPLWACSEDGDSFRGATYTAEEIAEHFAKGHWWEVSFAEEAPKEREMVFPFTVDHRDGPQFRLVISEGRNGYVDATDLDGILNHNLWTVEECREFIKEGVWIVKSVGPQKAPETDPEQSEGARQHAVAPTSPSKPLTVQVDSEQLVEATERAEMLAESIERVNIALESFQAILKGFNINVEVN